MKIMQIQMNMSVLCYHAKLSWSYPKYGTHFPSPLSEGASSLKNYMIDSVRMVSIIAVDFCDIALISTIAVTFIIIPSSLMHFACIGVAPLDRSHSDVANWGGATSMQAKSIKFHLNIYLQQENSIGEKICILRHVVATMYGKLKLSCQHWKIPSSQNELLLIIETMWWN